MPILPPEPSLYPPELLAATSLRGPASKFRSAEEPRVWWVLHTRPRQEKSVARQLLQARVPFYLPQLPRRNLIRGRVVEAQVPLFTSYVFLCGTARERVIALATHRVVRTIEVPAQERLWSDLRQIHQLIEAGAPITPEDKLAPGMRVEIKSGPLAGLRGKILRTASGRRFVVEVDFIQRGASVELDDFTLVKAAD